MAYGPMSTWARNGIRPWGGGSISEADAQTQVGSEQLCLGKALLEGYNENA